MFLFTSLGSCFPYVCLTQIHICKTFSRLYNYQMLCHRDCEYSASLDNAKLFSKVVITFYAPASVMEALLLHILIILGIV